MAINLRNVPKNKQTYDMCLESVKADWEQLQFVDERYRTEDLCREAIEQNGFAIQFVTKQTPELCLKAVRHRGHLGPQQGGHDESACGLLRHLPRIHLYPGV